MDRRPQRGMVHPQVPRLHSRRPRSAVGKSFYGAPWARCGALRRRSCRKTCYFCSRSFKPCSSAMTVRSARRRWCAAAPAMRSRSTPRALQPSTVAEEHRQLLRLQLKQLARRFEGPSCPWRSKSGRRASTARGGPPACCGRWRVQKELLPTSAVALCAAGVPWAPHPSRLGLSARAASPF